MTTGEDTHGCDYFTSIFLLPQLRNSTAAPVVVSLVSTGVGRRGTPCTTLEEHR
ncbi:hypothetical protein [Corynebacterium glutamicum]|uniref:hypothetical protein n=1 Tax=Corynebacterium glutamicum TaxID=1718 RepID=UPI00163D43A6|nr:hypothetical protein [Corynebacterium glutamicum]